MFTGLIEEVGVVAEVRPREGGRDLVVRARMSGELAVGESVALNGACLTVERSDPATFACHAGEETLRRTTLGEARPGTLLNLERSLTPRSRLGGHFVQGHVDGVGVVRARRPSGSTVWFEFGLPAELLPYLVPKGSVAVDGISLTVVECDERSFSIAIIPHTLAQTALRERGPGDRVNLEVDILAKYVERLIAAHRPTTALTAADLREQGF